MGIKPSRAPALKSKNNAQASAIAEAIEPRVLFSADLTAVALAAPSANAQVHQQASQAPAIQTASSQLFVVDLRITDVKNLLLGLEAQQLDARTKGEQFDILLLDANDDGITKISDALSQQGVTSALHLLGHGNDGVMLLGNTWIDDATLRSRAADFSAWSQNLSANADVLLYGCDFAISDQGKATAQSLSQLTGADVAASIDTTASFAKNGNWNLEFQNGAIEANTDALSAAATQVDWQGSLATYVVTNTNNAGAGSLRSAINQANANIGLDSITFNIAGAGVQTINLNSALPAITDTVVLDGTSQAGFTTSPLIELNGAAAGLSDGIQLMAGSSGSQVRGLIINRFAVTGIFITSNINTITGNYIGTSADGNFAQANGGAGIDVDNASGNVIGGNTSALRNVVSGNLSSGIGINGASASNNTVIGNYIGTNFDGTAGVGNKFVGIGLSGGASNNVIGGSSAGQGNLVSGNTAHGISLGNTSNTQVRGNRVGLNALGDTAIANGQSGIAVSNVIGDIIGGSGFGDGNTISGNQQQGILVDTSIGVMISGNLIGRNLQNTANLGNTGEGILLQGATTNTMIGGTSTAAANQIAGNSIGIATSPSTSAGNAFLGNQIFQNVGLGIDANADGITLNDPLDLDTGSNGLQNFPLLYTAHFANGDLVINGELNSSANATYRVEFFSSPLGNVFGYGDGPVYLGAISVSTDAAGNGYYAATLVGVSLPAGRRVAATATVDLGSGNYGSTSEFSRTVISTAAPPSVIVTAPVTPITPEAGGAASFSVVLDTPPTDNVTISLSVSDPTEGTISVGSLIFTPLNWNVVQVVTVSGVDDFLLDGAIGYSVVTSAAISTDAAYNGLAVADIALTTPDNDTYNAAVVDTTSDVSDGDVSSIAALYANRGADGKISLREAILAANNTAAPGSTVNHIHFNIQDPLSAGEHVITVGSSLPIVSRAVVIDASTDSDWLLNGSRPVVVLNGNDLSASGIEFSSTGGGSTVRGFVIRNFAGNAILLTYGADATIIAGNYIGSLNASGADVGLAFSNSFSGIYIDSSNNTIGGTSATDRNVIAGNLAAGILINASSGNVLLNNYIGTAASGLSLVGSTSGNGIGLYAGASNNQIGSAGFGNVIGGNNNGVSIHDAGSNLNRVQANFIGTDVSGTINLGNVQEGIEVLFGAANNLIGGASAGEGNTIFNNGGVTWAGVSIEDTSSGNAILGNRISNSGAVGIQLGWASFAPLPNDLNDVDDGANGIQNYPVLISAVSNGGNTLITGRINSTPNQSFRIEFFSSPTGDALGFGEARNYLGFSFVTTDPIGNATISTLLPGVSVPAGYVISSTATIDLGGGSYSSTSEFSQNVIVSAVPPGVTVTQPISNLTPEYGGSTQFSVVLDTAPTQNVTISLTVSDATEGAIGLSNITFTPLNWNVAQVVTVTGLNDTLLDGDISYSVITSATISADLAYSGLTVADIALVTPDNNSFNAVVVNTVNDISDGDTSSIAALYANRGSDGKISLREAILAANATVNPSGSADRIFFDIPDALIGGRHTINLTSALPQITDVVDVDGTTEPDYLAAPIVRISTLSGLDYGLILSSGSSGTSITGLMITNFSNAGIFLDTGSISNLITRNYIGTDGSISLGNGTGIVVRSDINFIGNIGGGNLISGNAQNGIQFLSGANSNFVVGNKIGTNAAGTSAIANGNDGIQIVAGADNNVIGTAVSGGGNVISGNFLNGVSVQAASGTQIKNNFVGLAAGGNSALGNGQQGVILSNGASGSLVGGATRLDGNIVSGNLRHGINISGPTTANNTVIGNYVGTNADGVASVGNNWSGISIDGNAKNNVIGGVNSGEGNVIAGGLGNGVTFSSSNTTGNKLLGNYIGTNRLGSTSIGNAYVGVEAVSNAGANQIGGVAVGEGNVIAHNGLQGVSITSGTGISILGNQIYANAGLGIDLNDDGVTENDLVFGDADAGANTLLNFPVFFSAEMVAGGYLSLGFTIDVPQLNAYRVEFYSSPAGNGDITLHGEARRYLGFREITVPATSTPYTVSHTFIPAFAVSAGDLITATVTLRPSASTFASTSEFSENIAVAPLATSSISGRVFDDVNTLGNPGASAGLSGARVSLFLDNGDGIANASDNLVSSQLTNSAGDYAFTNLASGTYWTVVESRSITGALNLGADANSVWWEQTYGAANSLAYAGAMPSFNALSGMLIGGARREVSDNFDGTAASLVGAEHLVRSLLLSGAAVNNVDFGFTSQVISTTLDGDDDAAAARSKQGSLRQFIQNSNALSGVQTSLFRLGTADTNFDAANGVWRFNISATLPTLLDGTRLDGYTQAAWFGDTNFGAYLPPADPLRPFAASPIDKPEIEIVGTGAAALSTGLIVSGTSERVSGLAIYGFETGIYVNGTSSIIQSNFIGVNALGVDTVNQRLNTGVVIDSAYAVALSQNLISHTKQNGLSIRGGDGVSITSNTISHSGLADSQYDGINVVYTVINLKITGNSILQSNAYAIDVGGSIAAEIIGNFIADSGLAGVERAGINVHSVVSTIRIESNVITRSHSAIWLKGDGVANVNLIGGVGVGNTLVGNQGVGIRLDSTNGTRIQGNYIGVTSALAPLANGESGIWASTSSSNTLIGGVNPGEGNVIANASGANASGILLLGNGYQTTILGNSIYQNGALGISLGANANTPSVNDLSDADLTALTGPQNYPVITSAQTIGATTLINGVLNSKAGRNYRVEVFRNPSSMVEANGYAEGAQYLGYFNVSTDALGQATFSQSIAMATNAGDKITATATEDFGAGFTSTSEFSAGVTVGIAAPEVIVRSVVAAQTSEAGATSLLGIRLSTAPTGNVVVNFASSDTSEGTLSNGSVTFTPLNWNVEQFATITGIDDSFVDGNKAYAIVFANAVSTDPAYSDRATLAFAMTNTDNDTVNTVVVDTVSDSLDGDTSSIEALYASKGVDGKISLREAILAANNTSNGASADRVLFNIPDALVSGAHTISLASALPTITQAVVIDASSEPDFVANSNRPVVVIDGNDLAVAGLTLGVDVDGSAVRGLVIRNFNGDAITIELGSDGNTIVGNYLGGLTTTGLSAGATEVNSGNGIGIYGANNIIGGLSAAERNVISGNQTGVFVYGVGAGNNVIQGNYIGVDSAGVGSVSNSNGVLIYSAANSIGGTSIGAGNLIAGNSAVGVLISNNNGLVIADGNTVQGNTITDNGTGITLSGASKTLIGGASANTGNVIANSFTSGGVFVITSGGNAANENTILGNQIFNNAGLGIDLEANGLAINDLYDVDVGANDVQNFPVLISAVSAATNLSVSGTFNSQINKTYRIEFFWSPTGDSSGNGEGRTFIGFTNVNTNSQGDASFSTTFNGVSVPVGSILSSTATIDLGAGLFASTSEFSKNILVSSAPPGITVSPPTVSTTDENGATSQFSVVLNSQPTANVTITLVITNLNEAGISTPTLTFTPANWNVAQVVTVTGENDSIVDGNVAYSILTEPAVSADPAYNGLDAADVNLVNLNVDTTNTFFVTNATDLSNGNVSSIANLLANDGGDGISLREAISAANNTVNSSGNVDQIRFAIPGLGGQTIFVNTALPTINEAVLIDGSTQPGFVGRPLIELRGNNNPGVSGLFLMPGSDGSTIRGLAINSFGNNGIEILSNANRIVGNYLGTNAAGNSALGNGANGIALSGANNTIGGTTAYDRNLISGNVGNGVLVYGAASTNNRILGNYVGTDALGSIAVANGGEGIILVTGANSNIIGSANGGGNVISGNGANGIGLNSSDGNIIQGNIVGLNAAGTTAIGNTFSGIAIGSSSFNQIGGSGVGQGNTISGNLQNGIYAINASATLINGNLIGRNFANAGDIGNGGNGIYFDGTSTSNVIGGTTQGSGNVIANNASGIATSTLATVELTILGNQIYRNVGLGIDLNWDAVTANDAADSDMGPNGLQNFPVLISAVSNGIDTIVSGTINSTPNTTLRIEFFNSAVSDGTSFGQAETYLGFTTVTTNLNGDANFYTTIVGVGSSIGSFVSATATGVNGTFYIASSEFARNVLVTSAPPGVSVSLPSTAATTEAGGVSQFSVFLNSPPSADVTLTLSLSDLSEASLSVTTLVFNASNWNVAQIVSVTGRDDSFVDGTVGYSVITSNVSSADLAYNGLAVADVALSNTDNDSFNAVVVDTVSDEAGGDISSIAALYANRGSDGRISLREAIEAANNTANGSQRDSILFDIADPLISGAHTINLLSSLPAVTDAVFIDGSSEPDFGASHVIELNGLLAGANTNGISIYSNGSEVYGLTINRFSSVGIYVTGDNNVLTDNYIGVDGTGILALANGDYGVYSTGSGLAINGSLIGNHALGGVYLDGQDALVDGNTFVNESTGVIVGGTSAGMRITNNASNNVANLIDLGNDGPTLNDTGDIDVGANNLQNTVSLSSVLTDGTSLTVVGSFNGEPSKTLNVDFYEHGTGGPSIRSRYVGSFSVLTDALGNANFNQVLSGTYSVGTIFSATATDTTLITNQSTSEHSNFRVSTLAAPLAPEVIVVTSGPIVVNEGGTSASVSLVLSTAPTADVTVNFSVSIAGEVTLSATSFTFTSANWNIPQILTITGRQDFIADGDTTLTLVTSNAISADLDYSGLVVADFAITNQAIPNLVPTIVAPLSYSVIEDVVSSLGGVTSGLVISDSDAGVTDLSVTLSVTNGLYSLGSASGLSFTVGDGTADTTMTFTGSAAQINAAIDSLIFIPTANFSGLATLSISVNDLGNTGTGGALSAVKAIPINVVASNDAATFTGSKTALLSEADSVLITPSMLQLTDIDTSSSDLVYSVVSQSTDGELKRAGVLLRVGDSFTQADIDSGLISYAHLGGESPSASITLAMSERFGASLPDVVLSFTVMPVNDAPIITDLVGGSVSEITTIGAVVGSVSAIDPDNFNGAQFSLIDSSGGAFSIESTTGIISVANALLIDFETASQHSIRVKVTDQSGASSERVFQIQVTDVAEFVPTTPAPTTPPPTTPPTVDPTKPPTSTTGGGTTTTGTSTQETLGSGANGTNGSNGIVSNPVVTFAEVARANGVNILKQRQVEAEVAVWVDSVQETRASGRKEVNRRTITMMELELLDADGFVKQRRSLNLDSLDALFKARKNNTAGFVPVNVLFYDFKLPADAQVGIVDEGKIDASERNKRFSVAIDSAEIGGVVLSVGVVAWVTRAGGLLAALMSALPAWKGLDPLLVLSPSKAKASKEFEDFSDTDLREDEEAVQAVLS